MRKTATPAAVIAAVKVPTPLPLGIVRAVEVVVVEADPVAVIKVAVIEVAMDLVTEVIEVDPVVVVGVILPEVTPATELALTMIKVDLAGVGTVEMARAETDMAGVGAMDLMKAKMNLKTRVVMAAVEVAATKLKMIAEMAAAMVNLKKRAEADLEVVVILKEGVRVNRAVAAVKAVKVGTVGRSTIITKRHLEEN